MSTLTVEQWRARGAALAKRHKGIQWEVADWIVSGAEFFPCNDIAAFDLSEAYDIAQELFPEYTRETLRHFAVTARAFPPCTRVHANLTFGHYRVAQSLPEPEKAEWLTKANGERWSVARLRRSILDFEYRLRHPDTSGSTDTTEPEPDPAPAPKPKAKKSSPDCIHNLPIPLASQIKLGRLARLYRIPPESLLLRVVDTFLELHAEDLALLEHEEKDIPIAEYAKHAAAFVREHGMCEEDWRKQQAEKHQANLAEYRAERAIDEREFEAQRAVKWLYEQAQKPYNEALAAEQAQAAALTAEQQPAPAETEKDTQAAQQESIPQQNDEEWLEVTA